MITSKATEKTFDKNVETTLDNISGNWEEKETT